MATITITTTSTQDTRILAAFANTYGYSAILPNGQPNPETQPQMVKRQIVKFITDTVKLYEAAQAADSARQSAIAAVDAQVTPTVT